MTQAAPSGTVNDAMTAAVAAYAAPGSASAMGSQWTELNVPTPKNELQERMDSNSYSARAWVNKQTGELIIANRGTIPTDSKNLEQDAAVAFQKTFPGENVARLFADAAIASGKLT